jgi:hypothetical protein
MEKASSLSTMMVLAWRFARRLAVVLVEEELAKRAQRPTEWPDCERCGKKLENKEFKGRQLTGLIGAVHWERRVGRCPDGCKTGFLLDLRWLLSSVIAKYQGRIDVQTVDDGHG